MKTKHYKVKIEDPLSQFNINKVLCQDTDLKESGAIESPEVESVCNDCFWLLDVHSEEEVCGYCSFFGKARVKARSSCSDFSSNPFEDIPGDDLQLSLWPV